MWHRRTPEGREWLRALPRLAAECAERWELSLGPPFPAALASLAMPVTTASGAAAVLKIQFPDTESEHEGAALRCWDGDGAVQLLDEDTSRRALLIERCVPGNPLSTEAPDAAIGVVVDLLPRLWRPAGPPFRSIAEEAARWRARLADRWEAAGKPFGRQLVDAALELLAELPASQGEEVLVDLDLHGDNVLRARRRPWLVIDPKPVLGERELSLAPLIRSDELGAGPEHLRRRVARLTSELGLDRGRAVGWTIAQTVAWNAGGGRPEHLAALEWLAALR